MTRQEAIKILMPFRNAMVDQYGCPISDAVFAIDVAIHSLEAWDKIMPDLDCYIDNTSDSGDKYTIGKHDGAIDIALRIDEYLKEVET